MANTKHSRKRRNRAGFTLTEVLIAASIAVIALAAVMSVFLWSGRQFSLCSKIAWSQDEAMRSSGKIASFIKNASAISGIDTNKGTWVKLQFPDGSIGTLTYSNSAPILRNGQLFLKRTNTTTVLVARGMTAIMDSQGFTTPVFSQIRANALRVSYRVSEPSTVSGNAADDADFAASVRFGVCLRNKSK
jgi:prepilin-type N-terminal cleavage/methylation domain-containing protein